MKRKFPMMLHGEGAGAGDPAAGAGGGGAGGGSGSGAPSPTAPDWRSSLSGDYAPLAKEKSLEQIKGSNWEEAGPLLAKGYVESQKMLGGMVAMPKADPVTGKVAPEAQRAFWDRLGVPRDTAGYKDVRLDVIEGLGAINEKLVETAKPVFLKMGMTPGQAQEMLNLYGAVTSQQRRELAEGFVAQQATLEEKWGLNFETNVNLAQRVLRKYFSEDFMKYLADSQLDMHPGMIEGFYNAGKNLGEARFIEGSEPTVADNEATEKAITDLRQEMSKMPEGPQMRAAQEKMELLYKKRYGTGPAGPQK